MSIQPNYTSSSPAIQAAAKSTDPEVLHLMSEIKDWEGCPTTDPHTKKEKVDALEAKLSQVESSLANHAKYSEQADVKKAASQFTGKGQFLDISA